MRQAELPKVDKRGRNLEVENGVVRSVSLSTEGHGCLTAWLNVEFKGGGCGFGGYMLGSADGGNLSKPGYAAEFIVRCLRTVGQTKWEDLSGRPVRCLHEGFGGCIVAIGNFIEDEWFCPREEFKGVQ